MATNDPEYMKRYQAERRAKLKPLQADDSLQSKPLQPLHNSLQDEPLQDDSLQDVKVEDVKNDVSPELAKSSLHQNILHWSWCYTTNGQPPANQQR